ncbi:MAG: hypothetical protein J6I40_01975 [Mailhella sp.]|nr:hypothetical protein [Mailhella sp.]
MLPSDKLARMANLAEAAEHLRISVAILKKLNADHTGPAFGIFKDDPFYAWDDLNYFMAAYTICRDGTVIPKVKAEVLGHKLDDHGREFPVLACCCAGKHDDGTRVLWLIGPDGVLHSHLGEKEFGSGDGYRSEGYFIQEVSDPELAGFSDEKYLGKNALHPQYEHVKAFYW